MRRWLRAVALGAVAALAVAGCGTPEGTDGDLTDDWKLPAAPVVFQPANGVCHPFHQEIGYVTSYQPVDCGQQHLAETVHLGALTGAHAERGTPPAAGSAARQAAFAECHREATRALGADWRTGRLGLSVVFPSPNGWRGGARWFRCDLLERASLDRDAPQQRTAGLKGALKAASPLAYGCFKAELVSGDVRAMAPTSCARKHDAEFVGVYEAPAGSFAAFDKNDAKVHRECLKKVAAYAKVPDDGNLKYRAGTIAYQPDEDEWQDGNRGVKCFLWLSGKLTRSVKGGGTKALPIQYA
ncbi:septum formation family protein [Micromonospora sp. WMMD882]|uniref:septum formation family protein n=1 Tax=Micromonospora sp. WMMD882 TaxID=3015151 RepID=UPI00248AF612|nr:septum formation family protein [Micromonospora sp. WMMD882]WBB82331.1 septum formation family protein [Micromonospora sp. WMMD882]